MGRTACTEPQCLYKGAFYLLKKFAVHGEFQDFSKTLMLMNSLFQRWNWLKDGLKSAGHEVSASHIVQLLGTGDEDIGELIADIIRSFRIGLQILMALIQCQ